MKQTLLLAAFCLVAAPLLAAPKKKPAQPPDPPAAAASGAGQPSVPAWLEDRLEQFFEKQLAPRFTLKAGVLDAEMLAAAQPLADAQRERMRSSPSRWAREAVAAGQFQQALVIAHAKAAQAMAVWGLDSNGPAHDERLLKALESRSACWRGTAENASELEARLQRISSLPATERAAALEDERVLLARWGQQPAPAAVPRLEPEEALRRLRLGLPAQASGAEPSPLPPLLAYWYLSPDTTLRRNPAKEPLPSLHCALQQWALLNALPAARDADERRRLLAGWREGLMLTAWQLAWLPEDVVTAPASASSSYPGWAQFFNLTGEVTLRMELDAQGRVLKASAVERKLQMMGLPAGERPTAFETLLDAASIRLASADTYPSVPADDKGQRIAKRTFVWSLEP